MTEWEKEQPLLHAWGYEFSRDADIDGGCFRVKAFKGENEITVTYIPCKLIAKLAQEMGRRK